MFGEFTLFKRLAEKSLTNEQISQKVINGKLIWMVLVWRIADDLPNLPNFLPTKLSRYMVYAYMHVSDDVWMQ